MPTDENPVNCPLCGEPLRDNPNECGKCDWVKGYRHRQTGGNRRDAAAAALSIIPGAGHLYKGHRAAGIGFLAGTGIALLVSIVAGSATMWWAPFAILPLYWLWVMAMAYWIEDKNFPQE
jgi:hypothetical protein